MKKREIKSTLQAVACIIIGCVGGFAGGFVAVYLLFSTLMPIKLTGALVINNPVLRCLIYVIGTGIFLFMVRMVEDGVNYLSK